MKVIMEFKTNSESKVSESVLSSYIIRAIAGVVGANKAMILSYSCESERKREN